MKQKILKMKASDMQEVAMWGEGEPMISTYTRIDDQHFQLLYSDEKELICPYCGMYIDSMEEIGNHEGCYDPDVITEDNLVDIIESVFNETYTDTDTGKFVRNIIQINGQQFTKRKPQN